MKKFEVLLKDMSHNTRYSFLEQGSDGEKLQELAAKFGVQLPANDLAIFKGTYAYVDRTNLNGCSLPNGEVVKALGTLRGKAVDFDHLRKRVVGYFLDAALEGDEVVCYGIFFKGNFPEDYDIIKECMAQGNLGISFEAWGDHVAREDGDYDLVDIEFAGGALLIASDPAFPGAGVLELAKKERVLEFAKVMTEPKEHVHDKKELKKIETSAKIDDMKISNDTKNALEKAKYSEYEFDMILRALSEVPYPEDEDEMENWREVSSIDFDNSTAIITYRPSGTVVSVDLTPKSVVIKKGKPCSDDEDKDESVALASKESFLEKFHKFDGNFDELEAFVQKEMDYKDTSVPEMAYLGVDERTKLHDNDFAVIKKIKCETSGKRRKVRMFPLNDPTHVRIALARLEDDNVKDTFKKLGISYDNTLQRILNKAKELKMNELLKKYEQSTVEEQASIFADVLKEMDLLNAKVKELTDAQETAKTEASSMVEAKDTELAALKAELETITTKASEAQTELDRRDAEITEAKLAERKETLGDTAEGMEDADILDEVKYELALLKKENAELKEAAAKAPKKEGDEVDLSKGSAKKDGEVDEASEVGKRVIDKAYPKQA